MRPACLLKRNKSRNLKIVFREIQYYSQFIGDFLTIVSENKLYLLQHDTCYDMYEVNARTYVVVAKATSEFRFPR